MTSSNIGNVVLLMFTVFLSSEGLDHILGRGKEYRALNLICAIITGLVWLYFSK